MNFFEGLLRQIPTLVLHDHDSLKGYNQNISQRLTNFGLQTRGMILVQSEDEIPMALTQIKTIDRESITPPYLTYDTIGKTRVDAYLDRLYDIISMQLGL